MRMDVHNHLMSPDLFERIESQTAYRMKRDARGTVLATMGNIMPAITVEERLSQMDTYGIDRQAVSFITFNFFTEEALTESPSKRLKLSQVVNDYFAEICSRHKDRLMAFADIPLLDVNDAVREIRRSVRDLGLHGASLFSHVHGKFLSSKEFWPFFEEVNELKVPMFLHPTLPKHKDLFSEFHLAALVGFPFETTLAVTRMVYSGLFERFKRLKLIVSHAGGTIPFLWKRLDRGYLNHWPGCRENISKRPTDYLRQIYYDTALSFPEALMLAHQMSGGHLVFGTDYPYTIPPLSDDDEVRGNIEMIESLDLPPEEKEKIRGLRALDLFSP